MDLFSVSPELKMTFSFLQRVSMEDDKFYSLVSKHALRVLGIINLLVKEVTILCEHNFNQMFFSLNKFFEQGLL